MPFCLISEIIHLGNKYSMTQNSNFEIIFFSDDATWKNKSVLYNQSASLIFTKPLTP